MIAEQCALPKRGAPLNAACSTCGHTLAAHTISARCDICDLALTVLAFVRAQQ